jgi:hypothetical protein
VCLFGVTEGRVCPILRLLPRVTVGNRRQKGRPLIIGQETGNRGQTGRTLIIGQKTGAEAQGVGEIIAALKRRSSTSI